VCVHSFPKGLINIESQRVATELFIVATCVLIFFAEIPNFTFVGRSNNNNNNNASRHNNIRIGISNKKFIKSNWKANDDGGGSKKMIISFDRKCEMFFAAAA